MVFQTHHHLLLDLSFTRILNRRQTLGHISWAQGEIQPARALSWDGAAVSATMGRRRKTCKLEKQETVVEDQLSESGLWA